MATQKITSQLDILATSNLINSNSGFIGFGAKSDGLYQKINAGSDLKLATTTDLTSYLPLIGGTMANTNLVTNLNCQYLNGQNGTTFLQYQTSLTNNYNANNLGVGVYLNSTGNGTGNSNFPEQYGSFLAFDSSYGKVQFNISNSNNFTFRNNWGGTWTAWNTIYNNGNLTNTLTSNYIPKWNGSTLVNSLINDNGSVITIDDGDTSRTLILNYNNSGDYSRIQSVHQSVAYTPLCLQTDGGNVLINSTTDNGTDKLQVNGSAFFNSNITATGDVTAFQTSDKRLKKNINKLNNSLEIINKLNPVSYNWNKKAKELNSTKTDDKNFGLIAQELEEILPELVHNMYNEEKIKGIDYIQLIPFLIKSIQELNEEINKLKNNNK
jgi:hypothetical protein